MINQVCHSMSDIGSMTVQRDRKKHLWPPALRHGQGCRPGLKYLSQPGACPRLQLYQSRLSRGQGWLGYCLAAPTVATCRVTAPWDSHASLSLVCRQSSGQAISDTDQCNKRLALFLHAARRIALRGSSSTSSTSAQLSIPSDGASVSCSACVVHWPPCLNLLLAATSVARATPHGRPQNLHDSASCASAPTSLSFQHFNPSARLART